MVTRNWPSLRSSTMLTTMGFALGLAALTECRIAPARWLATLLIQVGQSTPMPLLLFFGITVEILDHRFQVLADESLRAQLDAALARRSA